MSFKSVFVVFASLFMFNLASASFPVQKPTKKEHKVVETKIISDNHIPTVEQKEKGVNVWFKKIRQRNTGNGMSIASFCCAIGGLIIAGIPLGLMGVIFGAIGVKRELPGLATAGIIIGALDIILVLILIM